MHENEHDAPIAYSKEKGYYYTNDEFTDDVPLTEKTFRLLKPHLRSYINLKVLVFSVSISLQLIKLDRAVTSQQKFSNTENNIQFKHYLLYLEMNI